MSFGNQIFEKGPDGRFRLASDRTDSLDSLQEQNKPEEKKITDSAVSMLFALKFYPFRAPVLSWIARQVDGVEKNEIDGESRQFDGGAPIIEVPDVKEKKDNHLGVVALGVDFGLPGDSGFGYGEEWPFKKRQRKSGIVDVDDDDDSVSVDSFDEKRSSLQ